MFVYSGDCRLCECGIDSGIVDNYGNKLITGDIVVIYTEYSAPNGLTVVVSDQFQSYSDGTHEEKTEGITFYIMGIKNVIIGGDSEWRVARVKSYIDVIDGELWKDYGFRYSRV